METYRLSIESQEAGFTLANGEHCPHTISRGKLFVSHSSMPFAFQYLFGAMSRYISDLPLKCLSTMRDLQKLSADYKGCVISFSTTISIEDIEAVMEKCFATDDEEPSPAPEVQFRNTDDPF